MLNTKSATQIFETIRKILIWPLYYVFKTYRNSYRYKLILLRLEQRKHGKFPRTDE